MVDLTNVEVVPEYWRGAIRSEALISITIPEKNIFDFVIEKGASSVPTERV